MKHLILFLLILGCFGGCKKEVPIESVSILIGEPNEKMELVLFETPVQIVSDFHSFYSYKLNINKDHEDDFMLTSRYDASPGGIRQIITSIDVLNPNIELAVTERSDSFLLCSFIENDTLRQATYYTPQSAFICEGNRVKEFKGLITLSYPTVYSKGHPFPLAARWGDSSYYLCYFDQSFNVNYHEQHSILLGTWNEQQLKYIVFKMTATNETRYGWLLLSLSGYNHIQLHGYAIQK